MSIRVLILATVFAFACRGEDSNEAEAAGAEQVEPAQQTEETPSPGLAWATSGSLAGHIFAAGAEVRTGAAELNVTFQNGAELIVNEASLLRVTDEAPGQVIMARGFVQVRAGPARIATTRGTMSVSSGEAWVLVIGDRVWFGVSEGSANVERISGQTALSSGQMLAVGQALAEDSPEDIPGWVAHQRQEPAAPSAEPGPSLTEALTQLDVAVRLTEGAPQPSQREALLLAYESTRAKALETGATPDPVAQRRPRIRRALGL